MPKVKRNGDKVWFRLESGPGEMIGEGAVKPARKPETVVNVPFAIWEARRLAFVALAHLQAWEVVTFRQRACPATASTTASTRGGALVAGVAVSLPNGCKGVKRRNGVVQATSLCSRSTNHRLTNVSGTIPRARAWASTPA